MILLVNSTIAARAHRGIRISSISLTTTIGGPNVSIGPFFPSSSSEKYSGKGRD